jgi:hypothetical protein
MRGRGPADTADDTDFLHCHWFAPIFDRIHNSGILRVRQPA